MKSVKEQPLISVIVPVYKVEQYLDCCIESITNQTYKNLEIILVDDGSPDNSPAICDEWAKKDNRIKVIHKENGGAGLARNVGKAESNGEWLVFIDSDDYISTDMISVLANHVDENLDIIECELLLTESDNAIFDASSSSEEIYSSEEAMRLHIQDKLFKQTPVNKLYKRDVVIDEDFPVGKLIDDEFWTYRTLGNAKKLMHISQKLYAYRQQPDSAMHKYFSLKRFHAVEAKCQRIEYLKEHFPALVNEAKNNLWSTCLYLGQCSLNSLSKDDIRTSFSIINTTMKKYPLDNSALKMLGFDYKVWALMSKLSFKMVCYIRNVLKIGV